MTYIAAHKIYLNIANHFKEDQIQLAQLDEICRILNLPLRSPEDKVIDNKLYEVAVRLEKKYFILAALERRSPIKEGEPQNKPVHIYNNASKIMREYLSDFGVSSEKLDEATQKMMTLTFILFEDPSSFK